MELMIREPEQLPGIEWNKEELKNYLQEISEQYKTLAYTADQEKELKSDLAKLRKLDTMLQDRRKELKKLYLQPYEVFESELKEASESLSTTISTLSAAQKEIEAKWKEDRQILLRNEFMSYINELRDLVKFDDIDDGSQYKKSISDKKACEWIHARIDTIRSDLEALNTVPDEFVTAAMARYKATWSVTEALKEVESQKMLAEQRAKLKQMREEEAERRRRQEALRASNKDETPSDEETPAEEPSPAPVEATAPTEKIYTARLEIKGTMQFMMDLNEYMKAHAGFESCKKF